ncbi:hypothetical protein N2599_30985 (plasmid) [Rhizobium sullae]|uniref:Uncharacterized protein n=1 Tax=Rhizobium sullae TaxID=50338 RepID=A0ABY5XTJ8_RHISU|nr:hypothetical protein [Rhizobium sullae]UWU17198.1 hypothetical protein N2599_30985 [Rhizobium sullae]
MPVAVTDLADNHMLALAPNDDTSALLDVLKRWQSLGLASVADNGGVEGVWRHPGASSES